MPTTVTIPLVGDIDFPDSMSSDDINAAAKKLHEDAIASTVTDSRAKLTAANAKPLAEPSDYTTGRNVGVAREFANGAMVDRAVAGAKGEVKGFAGGLAAPVLLLGHALRHPIAAADEAEQAALGLGAAAYNAVRHPVDTYNSVAPAVVRFATDPENIGMAAGGVDAALAAPSLTKAAKATRVGKAVSAGVSAAANKIPGVEAAREVLAADRALPPLSADEKAAELSRAAELEAAAKEKMHGEALRINRNRSPHNPVMAQVTPVADAAASNPRVVMPVRRSPIVGPPEPMDLHAGVADLVTPTADAASASGIAAPEARLPYTASPAQPPVLSRVTSLADLAASNPEVAASGGRLPYGGLPEPQPLPDPHANALSKVVPLADNSARSLHTMEAPALANRGYGGTGDYYDPELESIFGSASDTQVPSDLTVVDNAGQPIANASSESAASAEALSRQSGMKARGQQFVVRKGGVERPLVGPEAVDYTPQPGEEYGIKNADGTFQRLSVGTRSGPMTHDVAQLIGNRGKGALSLAERQRLLAALLNRSGK
jgi:hypothetical protein